MSNNVEIELIKKLRKKNFCSYLWLKALKLNNFNLGEIFNWLRKQGIINNIKMLIKLLMGFNIYF